MFPRLRPGKHWDSRETKLTLPEGPVIRCLLPRQTRSLIVMSCERGKFMPIYFLYYFFFSMTTLLQLDVVAKRTLNNLENVPPRDGGVAISYETGGYFLPYVSGLPHLSGVSQKGPYLGKWKRGEKNDCEFQCFFQICHLTSSFFGLLALSSWRRVYLSKCT